MKFSYFCNKTDIINNKLLPGIVTHQKLAPVERQIFSKYNIPKSAKKASVIILIFPDKNNESNILLTKRAQYKGTHSNQISFPGGKKNKIDLSLETTALRESNEEVGVDISHITVHKQLTSVYIPPSNFNVAAYLSSINYTPNFIKNYEVAEIIYFPIKELLNDENTSTFNIAESSKKNTKTPCFMYKNHCIWGATAMILNEVKELLKNM